MSKPDDYVVGYGKPPKATQFKKGQSGNPKGRKKGSLNANTMMQKIVGESITVTEKGQERTMPVLEVLLRRMVHKGLNGDLKAIPMVLNLSQPDLLSSDENAPDPEADTLRLHTALLKVRRGMLPGKPEDGGAE